MRDFGTLSPKWDASIEPLPSGFKELCGRGSGEVVKAREDRGHQGNSVIQTQQDGHNHGLPESAATVTEPAQIQVR